MWVTDKNNGLQFKASFLTVITPTTKKGIEKYLGSGMVCGISPHITKKRVKVLSVDMFDVIENEPQRRLSLNGIRQKRTQQILFAHLGVRNPA